jgi:hypothetical protein
VVGNGTAQFTLPKLSLRDSNNTNIALTPQIGQAVLSGCGSTISVVPGQVTDCTLPVTVSIEGLPQGQAVNGFNLKVAYDPALLQYQSNQSGSFAAGWTWFTPTINNTEGTVEFSAGNFSGNNPPSSGTVLTLTFQVVGNGTAQFTLPKLSLRDSNNTNIALTPQIGQAVLSGCPIELPTVVTSDATEVGTGEAVLNGSVTNNGGGEITEYGFYWGTTDNPTTILKVGTTDISGSFSTTLGDLDEETTYYYKAYAVNSKGTGYGEVKSFKTNKSEPVVVEPVVETGEATEIGTGSAVLNGSVTDNGGGEISEYGFYWGTTDNPTTILKVGTTDISGSFSTTLGDLDEETTYYYKAYAVNSAGTGYGEVKSFTTKKSGTVDPPELEVTVELSRTEDVNYARPLGIEGVASESVDWQIIVKNSAGDVMDSFTADGTSFNVEYRPEQTDLPYSAEYTVEVTATPAEGDPVVVTKTFGVTNYSFKAAELNVSASGGSLSVSGRVENLEAQAKQVQGILQVTNSAGDVVDLHIGEPVTIESMGSKNLEFSCSDIETPGTYQAQLFLWLQTEDGWIILGDSLVTSFII